MAIRLGLCGSHRTGKTTLAEAVSRTLPIPFVKTSTSQVFAQHGLHPAQPMSLKTRLWIQQRVLEAAEAVWQTTPGDFVTDRTPIDMMAYTLGDIQGSTEVEYAEVEEYLQRCFAATNRFFTTLVVVQPGIPLIHEEGKAALNKAYLEHLNYLVLGLCNDERLACAASYIKREITDLEERVRTVLNFADAE